MLFPKILATVYLLCHLVAAYFPSSSWNWGLWHLQYWVSPLKEFYIALGIGLLWTPKSVWLRWIQRMEIFKEHIPSRYTLLALPPLVFCSLFLMRTTKISGDMLLIQSEVMGDHFNPTRFGILFYALVKDGLKAVGTLFSATPWNYGDIQLSNAVSSCLMGTLFVILTLCLVKKWKMERGLIPMAFLFTMGFMQVFFGHAEVYAVVLVAFMLVIHGFTDALHSPHKRATAWKLGIFLGLATMVHPSGSFLWFPTLILLGISSLFIARNPKTDEFSKSLNLTSWGMNFFAASVLGILFWFGLCFHYDQDAFTNFPLYFKSFDLSRSLVPLGEVSMGDHQYSLFSCQHLANVINHELLLAPFSLVGFLGILVLDKKWKKDHLSFIILMASIPFLLFSLTINPDLGPLADWDIFSLSSLMLTLPLLYYFCKSSIDVQLTLGIPLVIAQLFHLIPWIIWNAGYRVS